MSRDFPLVSGKKKHPNATMKTKIMANDQNVAAGPIASLTGTKNSMPRNAKPPLNPPKISRCKRYMNSRMTKGILKFLLFYFVSDKNQRGNSEISVFFRFYRHVFYRISLVKR